MLSENEGAREARKEGTKPVTPKTHPSPLAVAPLTFLPLWLFGDLLPRLPVTERGRGSDAEPD